MSKERDGMISPDVQRTAITEYATRRGYDVVEWREGIDESGSRARSAWWPRLDQAVGMVESGEIDVILVWKYSRTARNRLRWAVALDRVETAGGAIESATEQFDTSTSTGRFTRGMLAEIAAWEAERTGDVWKEVQARRIRQGLPANGKPRFGYRVVDGRHVPDPETGPVLAELYRRYLAGESVWTLINWLHELGIVPTRGYQRSDQVRFSREGLRQLLDSGFGAGYHRVAGELQQGVHEPVIDAETWSAYLAARAKRRGLARGERSTRLMIGLMRCCVVLEDGTVCGGRMVGGAKQTTRADGRIRDANYRCSRAASTAIHRGGYISEPFVHGAVREWVAVLADRVDDSADAALAARAKAARRQVDAKKLAGEITELERAITAAGVDRAKRLSTEAEFRAIRDELRAQQARLEERRRIAQADAAAPPAIETARDLRRDWDVLSLEQVRATLRELIEVVEIHPDAPRVRVSPREKADPSL